MRALWFYGFLVCVGVVMVIVVSGVVAVVIEWVR